jgi:5'-3' exonuclease
MNQQRARRFSTAQEITSASIEKEECLRKLKEIVPERNVDNVQTRSWDHNVITPGTIFMEKISHAVEYYLLLKLKEEKWKNLKIVFSDAQSPGEGEHKLFTYIRNQTEPNLTHVIHGLDADLIMLSSLSGERCFLLRENLFLEGTTHMPSLEKNLFIFSVPYFLEQMTKEFTVQTTLKKENAQDFINDFILMCMFVGNDFIPRFPGLIIKDDAIDIFLQIYKKFIVSNDHLTKGTLLNIPSILLLLKDVGAVEDNLFPSKVIKIERGKHYKKLANSKKKKAPYFKAELKRIAELPDDEILKRLYKPLKIDPIDVDYPQSVLKKSKNWKDDMYRMKFPEYEDLHALKEDLACSYIEGLVFCWKYYTQGVQSWDWYFPYHYAPFSSDIFQFSDAIFKKFKGFSFPPSEPFRPFDQLMSVMPKNSSHCLPKSYQKEMLSDESPLSSYYPSDFKTDLFLGDQIWKSIVLLPFIDSTLLRNVTSQLPLDESEQKRNQFKYSKIYFNLNQNTEEVFSEIKKKDDFALYSFDHVQGWLKSVGKKSNFGKTIKSPVTNEKYPDIEKNNAYCAHFLNPSSENEFKSNLFPLLNKPTQKDGNQEEEEEIEKPIQKKKLPKKSVQEEEIEEPIPKKKKVLKKKPVQDEEIEESIPKKVSKKKPIQDEEEQEIDEPIPKKVPKKKPIQEEEIEEPIPKKKKVLKKKPVQEEEEIEEIEEPIPKKKKVLKKKPVQDEEIEEPIPKKKVSKKKTIQEVEEEIEESVPKKKVKKVDSEIVTKKRKLATDNGPNKKNKI